MDEKPNREEMIIQLYQKCRDVVEACDVLDLNTDDFVLAVMAMTSAIENAKETDLTRCIPVIEAYDVVIDEGKKLTDRIDRIADENS